MLLLGVNVISPTFTPLPFFPLLLLLPSLLPLLASIVLRQVLPLRYLEPLPVKGSEGNVG